MRGLFRVPGAGADGNKGSHCEAFVRAAIESVTLVASGLPSQEDQKAWNPGHTLAQGLVA